MQPTPLATHDPRLTTHLLDTGYCVADEATILRGAPRRKIACHAPVALLGHPLHGWTLFDTGYAPRIFDATRGWPFNLYRRMTPLRLPPRGAVVDQLGALGLGPSDIRRIVVSHFHADHIAGLRDFPHARFIASRAAWDDASARQGFRALLRGVIPTLIPGDFAARADLLAPFTGPPLPALGPTHDLFGDGSALLVDLPGHARGQIGLLARTERGPLLLAADGCWLSRSYQERRPPAPLAGLIADDARAVTTTIARLHAFATARPDVAILPTHCPEALGASCGARRRGSARTRRRDEPERADRRPFPARPLALAHAARPAPRPLP
jgi:glyoxylase-like metal-dependent hydrolase (beta-lactamase superfamily II)